MDDAGRISRRNVLLGAAATAALAATRVLPAHAEDAKPSPPRLPVGFVGHGSPMLAVTESKGKDLARWAQSFSKPSTILVVSAHFERAPITIGATRTLPLIYDFGGFPRSLYQLRYAAPGAPALAKRVQQLVSPLGAVRQDPRRGHDHGTWVPLRWMVPRADVPVLSVSLPSHDPRTLLRIGRALRPLRDEGVLLLGSGSLTHNLRRLGRDGRTPPPTWARDFDAWVATTLSRFDRDALLDWQRKAPAARTNHPTVEHFVPLLLAAGARHDDDVTTFPVTGFENASISRRCVMFSKRVG